MRGKVILLINFILSLIVFIMFLPFLDGHLVGLMFSGIILVLALVVLIILFLSLVYAIRIIFVYKILKTASWFNRILLIWPFFQLILWGILLM